MFIRAALCSGLAVAGTWKSEDRLAVTMSHMSGSQAANVKKHSTAIHDMFFATRLIHTHQEGS
ncbi:hypothetical protein CVT26_008772 [Gymnopilus dilepis]|uniref:Uncharacterized protein n=1 Tax=Gymnopilus dilepis TaxID=231916 RepID=A0A409WX64_9AGAR|nr:hypothetical protein CVT26_008772 [Gymnopilus dilepis]